MNTSGLNQKKEHASVGKLKTERAGGLNGPAYRDLLLGTKPVKGCNQAFLKGMIEPSGGFSFKRKKPMPLAAFG
jgi:hypothetical protein